MSKDRWILNRKAFAAMRASRALVRLRLYKDNFIRVDAHRDHGGQEFMGMVMGTNYAGNGIPGDAAPGTQPPRSR